MPGTNRLPPLLALLFVLAALSGCGSGDDISGEIPQENAADLNNALAAVRTATEASPPDCGDAAVGAKQFVDAVNALPADPAAELKTELQVAGDNLRTLVDAQCPATAPSGTTGTQPDTTTTTEETETATTTDETAPTETTTTTEETTTTGDENGGGPPGGGPPGGGPPGGGTDGGTGGTGGGTGDETGD
jgi:hypothetical protein